MLLPAMYTLLICHMIEADLYTPSLQAALFHITSRHSSASNISVDAVTVRHTTDYNTKIWLRAAWQLWEGWKENHLLKWWMRQHVCALPYLHFTSKTAEVKQGTVPPKRTSPVRCSHFILLLSPLLHFPVRYRTFEERDCHLVEDSGSCRARFHSFPGILTACRETACCISRPDGVEPAGFED